MSGIDAFISGFADIEPGYLDFARVGPLSPAAHAESRILEETLSRARFGTLVNLLEQHPRMTAAVSELTGFPADQVVVQPNTGTGLMQTMFALSGGLLFSPADFPSVPYAVMRAHDALGQLNPIALEVEGGRVTPESVRSALSDEVSAVAVCLVDSRTGFTADIGAIRDVIGDRLLIVDAIQGFGVVPAAFEAADVVVSGGHKWIRAGWGTGFLALSERALDRLTPRISGFPGTDVPEPWDSIQPPSARVTAYSVSHPDRIALARFAGALEEIATVGVGQIARMIATRVAEVRALVEEFDIELLTPVQETLASGILVLDPAPEDASRLSAALHNAGITATVRAGQIRLSVHAGTGSETIALLRSALGDMRGSRRP